MTTQRYINIVKYFDNGTLLGFSPLIPVIFSMTASGAMCGEIETLAH